MSDQNSKGFPAVIMSRPPPAAHLLDSHPSPFSLPGLLLLWRTYCRTPSSRTVQVPSTGSEAPYLVRISHLGSCRAHLRYYVCTEYVPRPPLVPLSHPIATATNNKPHRFETGPKYGTKKSPHNPIRVGRTPHTRPP